MLTPEQKGKLQKAICDHFTVDEMRTLLLGLVESHEEVFVDPKTKREAGRKLIEYFINLDKVDELISVCHKERPKVNWYEIVGKVDLKDSVEEKDDKVLEGSLLKKYHSSDLHRKSPFQSREASSLLKDPESALLFYVPLNKISPETIINRSDKCIAIYGKKGSGKTHLAIALKEACKQQGILCVDYAVDEWVRYVEGASVHDQEFITQSDHIFALIKAFLEQLGDVKGSEISAAISRWKNDREPNNLDTSIREYADKYANGNTSHNIFEKIAGLVTESTSIPQKIYFIADGFVSLLNIEKAVVCARELMRIPIFSKHFPASVKLVFFVPEEIFNPVVKSLEDLGFENRCSPSINLSWVDDETTTRQNYSSVITRRLSTYYKGDFARSLAIGKNSLTQFSDFFIDTNPENSSAFEEINATILDLLVLNIKINAPDGIPTGFQVVDYLSRVFDCMCNEYDGYLPIPVNKWADIKKKLCGKIRNSLLAKIPENEHGFELDPIDENLFLFGKIPISFGRSEHSPKFLKFLIENPRKNINWQNFAEIRGDSRGTDKSEQTSFKKAKERFKKDVNEAIPLLEIGDLFVINNQPISFAPLYPHIKEARAINSKK